MKLVIVHYHLRPGGIRRIIELASGPIARRMGFDSVTLACGEADDRRWNDEFRRLMKPVPVEFFVEPSLNYVSEQRSSPAKVRAAVVCALNRLLDGATKENCVVWTHNPGIARNLFLTGELSAACEARGVPLVAHHHDWWFDNRWLRWPEMRRYGVRTLAAAAKIVFPRAKTLRYAAINHADSSVLRRHFHRRSAWLPNLTERAQQPPARRVIVARRWLQTKLGGKPSPVWILPCRLLRRKNVAEALLLTRWLRPDAWLVTTGGVSSSDEQSYFKKLNAAAHQHHWRLRLGVLAGDETHKPSVPELIAASECVMLTSIQEGFGLPYLEAAAAERPLIARSLPNIAPDLGRFGFCFPQYYGEILVPVELFDWKSERARQAMRFNAWKRQLPAPLRKQAAAPAILARRDVPGALPFSRLSLDAQLQVLSQPALRSWELCAPLNPFLKTWRQRAESGRLQVTRWPAAAAHCLSAGAYAEHFSRLLSPAVSGLTINHDASEVQSDFIGKKLAAENVYPLLWSSRT
ncbi:MAG TPA: glycosyltransferase [Verrucomicrobiota bacterium]|nr:glycosyltransferase [Verrucomicrobiota bacterium]